MGIIGLGQAGGAIAQSFASLGYECIAFNTSESDLKTIDLPDESRFILSPKAGDGAGRDRETGGRIIRSNAPKILEIVRRKFPRSERLLVCGGLAGGTGGNLGKLCGISSELGLPVSAIGALPFEFEGTLDRYNAVLALHELIHSPLNGLILIRNDALLDLFPDSNLEGFLGPSNDYIAEGFDYFNRINLDTEVFPFQSFDGEDIRRILSSGGIQVFGSIDNFTVKNIADRVETLERLLYQESPWPEGISYSEAKTGGLILSAPEEFFQNERVEYWAQWMEAFSGLTRGCGCYFGLFRSPPGSPLRLSVILTGLPLPEGVYQMIDSVRLEAKLMRHKLDRDIVTLDTSPLENLTLFTSAADSCGEQEFGEMESDRETEIEIPDSRLEEVDVISMGREKTEVSNGLETMAESEAEVSADDEFEISYSQKRSFAPFILWPAVGIIILTALFIFRDYIMGGGATGGRSGTGAGKLPLCFVSYYPAKDIFYIVVDKAKGRLDLYNSQPSLVQSYRCRVNVEIDSEDTLVSTPTGIYFAVSLIAPDEYGEERSNPAFVLNYPNPLDSIIGFEEKEIHLASYPITPPENLNTEGNVILASEDFFELSNFVIIQRTPIIILDEVTYSSAGETAERAREVKDFIYRWSEAWDERNPRLYSGFYSERFFAKGKNKVNWLDYNRRINENVSSIRANLKEMQILEAGAGILAVVDLRRISGSGSYREKRRLYLMKEEAKWSILSEEILP